MIHIMKISYFPVSHLLVSLMPLYPVFILLSQEFKIRMPNPERGEMFFSVHCVTEILYGVLRFRV